MATYELQIFMTCIIDVDTEDDLENEMDALTDYLQDEENQDYNFTVEEISHEEI